LLLRGVTPISLYCYSAGQHWATHRKLLTPAFHFKVLENFVDVFNRNGKILVEKLSSHVNGPKFDVTPYMTLCALDNISGECCVNRLYNTKLEMRSFLDTLRMPKPHQEGQFWSGPKLKGILSSTAAREFLRKSHK
jgi:cytochrome P450